MAPNNVFEYFLTIFRITITMKNMKTKFVVLLPLFIVFLISNIAQGQTYNLKFEQIAGNSSEMVIEIYMSGSSAFKVGTSNLVFEFDPSIVDNPSLVSEEFSAVYMVDVDEKSATKADFNFVYGTFWDPAGADDITAYPSWTKLGTVRFDVVSSGGSTDLTWLESATTETVIYDSNANRLSAGTYVLDHSSGTLPVELVNFQAERRGNDAQLEWTTASEENAYGFQIERSLDGFEFEKIGFELAQGGISQMQSYHWVDADVRSTSKAYYRLKMIDLDETYEYSPVRVVAFDGNFLDGLNIGPNPAKGYTNLSFQTNKAGTALIQIMDTQGKMIQESTFETIEGVNQTTLGFEDIPTGTYQIRLSIGEERNTQKLFIVD